jgi:hypothetical protein
MRKEIRGHCPCGYVFSILGEVGEGVLILKRHFAVFHKDYLPFGITDREALCLIKKTISGLPRSEINGKKRTDAEIHEHKKVIGSMD